MAQGNSGAELNIIEVMERVKKDLNGPEQRAGNVLNILARAGVTDYDALCFAVEFIASRVGTLPWLENPARDLVRLLYIAHYIRGESVSWLQSSTLQSGA